MGFWPVHSYCFRSAFANLRSAVFVAVLWSLRLYNSCTSMLMHHSRACLVELILTLDLVPQHHPSKPKLSRWVSNPTQSINARASLTQAETACPSFGKVRIGTSVRRRLESRPFIRPPNRGYPIALHSECSTPPISRIIRRIKTGTARCEHRP